LPKGLSAITIQRESVLYLKSNHFDINGKSNFPDIPIREILDGAGVSFGLWYFPTRQAEILKDENSRLSNFLDAIEIGIPSRDRTHATLGRPGRDKRRE
jgi:hypothetical protein